MARLLKFPSYFEHISERNGSGVLVGNKLSYADLSLFQMIEGLRHTIPRAMTKQERKQRRVVAASLASERRLPFNQDGIFRHYPELDDRS